MLLLQQELLHLDRGPRDNAKKEADKNYKKIECIKCIVVLLRQKFEGELTANLLNLQSTKKIAPKN